MDFLHQPRHLFENNTTGYNNIFVSVYPKPGGKGAALLYQEGAPDELWPMVETTIRHAANIHSAFNIRIARNSKNDPSPVNIPVSVIGPQTQNNSAISGHYGGYQQQQTPPVNIGEIESKLEQKFAEKLQNELEKRELADRIGSLEYELKAKRRRSGDTWEKIEGFVEQTQLDLSNPQSIQAIGAIVETALDKILGVFKPVPKMAPPAVGHTTHVVEKGATDPIPDDNNEPDEPGEVDFNRAIITELNRQGVDTSEVQKVDFNPAIEAVMMLHNAGAKNPGALLQKVAAFYEKDPERADKLINQFLS